MARPRLDNHQPPVRFLIQILILFLPQPPGLILPWKRSRFDSAKNRTVAVPPLFVFPLIFPLSFVSPLFFEFYRGLPFYEYPNSLFQRRIRLPFLFRFFSFFRRAFYACLNFSFPPPLIQFLLFSRLEGLFLFRFLHLPIQFWLFPDFTYLGTFVQFHLFSWLRSGRSSRTTPRLG